MNHCEFWAWGHFFTETEGGYSPLWWLPQNVSQISPLDSPLGFRDSMFCGCSGRLLGRGFSASFVSCPVSLVPLNDDATRVQLFVPCPYYTHSPRICSLTTWFPCRIMQTDNSHSNICSPLLTPVEIWRPIGPLCLSLLRVLRISTPLIQLLSFSPSTLPCLCFLSSNGTIIHPAAKRQSRLILILPSFSVPAAN